MRLYSEAVDEAKAHLRTLYKRKWAVLRHLDTGLITSDHNIAALFASTINWLAKISKYEFYQYKPALVRLAAHLAPEGRSGQKGGVVYVDTALGQVSFHMPFDEVYEDLDEGHIANLDVDWEYPGEWSGVSLQEKSPLLLARYMRHRFALERKMEVN